ncbi:metallophosphoesterase [Paenibacillus sp. IHB B 3084]|uniref:lasso peptide biosynthesis PqqD family chaperone n=1 Tax=Paenibacillus TaxID=44249 RepID=UPI0007213830|nr:MULTISPECIES: lasso peptide biosynthesis PqqD family chaperone [Paenibacillus]ALP35728.1 metallophosphoesterase [Paenibacillus sp. IHB B 3084]MBE0335051.1 lasso peptide biosynthesis PqqD family chaperone [Paenibacillus sp. 23TSA30-6]
MAANHSTKDHDRVIHGEEVYVSDMDGEKVMMSINTGKYYNLGFTGGRIWELAESCPSLGEIVAALTDEYEVDEERCRQQVHSFVAELEREGLLKLLRESV